MRALGATVAWTVFLVVVATVLGSLFGWLEAAEAVPLAVGAFALGGLWLVLRWPWDLYFAARAVAARAGGGPAGRWAPQLLALALGLHLLGAGACAAAGYLGLGLSAYAFAAAYVLALAFRPLAALHASLSARLREMDHDARFPADDVAALKDRVAHVEDALQRRVADRLEAIEEELRSTQERHAQTLAAHRRDLDAFDRKVDRVLDELARSVERLTRDRELLAGLRAFVKLVKEG
jgi:hypothetical protein